MASVDTTSVILGDEFWGEFKVECNLSKGIMGTLINIKNVNGNTFASLDSEDARTLAAILLGMADSLDAN